MRRHLSSTLLLFTALLTVSLSARSQSDDAGKNLPPGKGKEYLNSICQQCHGLEQIISLKQSYNEWKDTVDTMVSNGAPLNDDEVEIVAQYLAKNFGPADAASNDKKDDSAKAKINVNKATAKELQSGLDLTEKEVTAIVAYRDKHGIFKNVEELKKVDGVDAKKIDAAKDRLEF